MAFSPIENVILIIKARSGALYEDYTVYEGVLAVLHGQFSYSAKKRIAVLHREGIPRLKPSQANPERCDCPKGVNQRLVTPRSSWNSVTAEINPNR
jgi:hypothetical protein